MSSGFNMNIDIRWDKQKTDTLICEFNGDWTWHECREAMQVMLYMQEGFGMEVDHVYDVSNSTLATRTLVKRMKKLLAMNLHPAPRQIVIIDQDYRAGMLEAILGNITHPLGIDFAGTLSEARNALYRDKAL